MSPRYSVRGSRADFYVSSILDVDFNAISASGARGVLLDVDNTLVPPGEDMIEQRVVNHIRQAQDHTDIARWALASNTRRELSTLATKLDVEVVRTGRLIAKPRSAYYRRALALFGLSGPQVAMIGDRALHDTLPPSKLGLVTVLVDPRWPDQWIDRLLLRRARERGVRMRSASSASLTKGA